MNERQRPLFWIVLFILIVAGMWRLRFDVDVLNLLPRELPVVRGLQLYQHHFTDSRELIVTVRAGDAEQTETAARLLATALRGQSNLVSSVMWQPAWMERPLDAAELIGFLWLNQPPAVFGDLTNHLIGTNIAATVAEAREQLATSLSPVDLARRSYDPFNLLALPVNAGGAAASFGEGQNLFASADGTFRILFVKAASNLSNYRVCIEWLRQIKAVIDAQRTEGTFPSNVVVAFTGGPAFVAEISGGMEKDMRNSVGITSAIIAILFWIFHRRWVPMLWLLVLLGLILACTLALGGLIFGAINVVSLGFAGILLGLAVDYGVVHYQEAMASPNAIIPEIRRAIGPSIFWAAVTTISAFLVLNLSGLPGLAQLGSLVALGVMLSALVMLFAFLPPLFRDRLRKRREQIATNPALAAGVQHAGEFSGAKMIDAQPDPLSAFRKTATFALTTMLILVPSAVLKFSGLPKIDSTSDALRPRNSPAYVALDEMKVRLAGNREPIWLIAQGHDESAIIREFESALPLLNQAVSNQVLSEFTLPLILWPHPEHQTANRVPAAAIVAERQNLHAAALDQGFTPDSLRVADTILNTWQAALDHPTVFWPTNELSRWVLEKVAARDTNGFIGVGFLFPSHPHGNVAAISELADALRDRGLTLSGWQLLGSSILKRVQQNLWKVLLPMIALVLVSLWLAFRHPTEIGLSLAVLALSGLALAAVMRLFGWSWNLMNLMALPLMLGSGVDYSIFMQLALRRHGGNLAAAHHAVGRALLLCGGTAVAGFGSLSLSTNAGMASLGEVCATGIGLNMLIAVFLLPTWWRTLRRRTFLAENSIRSESGDRMAPASETSTPSSLYRAELWRVGLWTARVLPRGLCLTLGRILAAAYWHLRRERSEIVIENLLPLLDGNRVAAKTKARQLFRQFAVKLIDLWRYEAGLPINHLMGQTSGWEHFARAQAEKRGVLVITPHLGNWEFGGPALTERGIKLQVVTLAEPGRNFTELRQASRAHWQIETLVIGNDPFAVLEIIKRLESGAVVALLIDRPPPTSAIEVEFCGRPFSASVAAAELARATGCVVLPVYLPREGDTYAARVLPAVDYERAALRDPAERRRLTQQIMRAFEPVIRQHSDQWYHFVPIWPRQK